MDKNLFKKCMIFSLSLLITLGIGILIFFIFYNFKSLKETFQNFLQILRPILYGIVIAYLLRPICNFFELQYKKIFAKINKKEKISERKINTISLSLAIITSFLLIFLIIFFLLKMIIPQLISSIPLLIDSIEEVINSFVNFIKSKPDNKICQYIDMYITKNNLLMSEEEIINKYITPQSSKILTQVYDSVSSVLLIMKDVFIGLIVSVYLLVYKRRLGSQLKLIMYATLPKKVSNVIYDEINFGDKIFNGFLVGKIIDSLIIGIITYACLSILQMPFTELISVIIGVTNVIPFFGPFIGAIPSFIIIFAVSPVKSLIFVVFIIILQQIDGNIIGPKILGSATGVSSFWVLFSILIFGGLFGVPGMIIGIPTFAIMHDIIKKVIYRLLQKKNEKNLIDEYNNEYHNNLK